jgi:hypothetical protein
MAGELIPTTAEQTEEVNLRDKYFGDEFFQNAHPDFKAHLAAVRTTNLVDDMLSERSAEATQAAMVGVEVLRELIEGYDQQLGEFQNTKNS